MRIALIEPLVEALIGALVEALNGALVEALNGAAGELSGERTRLTLAPPDDIVLASGGRIASPCLAAHPGRDPPP
jgi:hypothetical protein